MPQFSVKIAVVSLAASLLMGGSVAAWELVEGGYADAYPGYTPANLVVRMPDAAQGSWTVPSIGFTPRHRSSTRGLADGRHVAVRLDIASDWSRLEYVGPAFERREQDNMMVGGALQVDELAILGAVGRASLFGETADLVTAGMAFGGLQARVSVGETDQEVQGASDVMMFSTDLRIAPWITIQGDVAVTEQTHEEEPLAMGRVGVRLRF